MAQAVATGLAEHGIDQLDAPVSGGVGGAEKGTIAVMVSGPENRWEQYKAAFDVIGNPFFVGQLLSKLHDEGLIALDERTSRWTWELDSIRASSQPDSARTAAAVIRTNLPCLTIYAPDFPRGLSRRAFA